MDPQFPKRLLEAGPYRIIDYIQYMYEDFTKRQLTKKSDRSVAFRGVEERIARAVSSDAHHGILNKYLHRLLLWQRPEGTTMEPINYGESTFPSWSWQALYGRIEFAVPAVDVMEWLKDISISMKHQHLEVELATFQNVTVKRIGLRCVVVNKADRGVEWIRYDLDRYHTNFHEQRYVVLGRKLYGSDRYFGLIVEQTTSPGNFSRIGIAGADPHHLSRLQGRVRIV
jgi:hypothetical protein